MRSLPNAKAKDWAKAAVKLTKSRGGVINNRELKSLAVDMGLMDSVDSHTWNRVDAPLKDLPLHGKTPTAFVPAHRQWWWDPPAEIFVTWVLEVLRRHKREIERILDAMAIPKYAKHPKVVALRPQLIGLKVRIQKVLDEMDRE